MTKSMTLRDFGGYLTTWSARNTYLKKHPDREDPMISVMKRLLKKKNLRKF